MNDSTHAADRRRPSARPESQATRPPSRAIVPRWLAGRSSGALAEALVVGVAVLVLAALAQLAVPMPGSPVPVTGQSFGVVFLGLLLGRARAGATLAVYLAAGMAGLPVFADGGAGPKLGPGFGYLGGMAVAAVVTGGLADRGASSSLGRSTIAAILGTAIILLCGAAGLLLYLPPQTVLPAGVLPFLPGAAVKILLAACLACWLDRRWR